MHDGVPTLIFRVANERNSFITEATAKLWMLAPTQSAEGRRFIGFRPMQLLKKRESDVRSELDAVPSDRRGQSRCTAWPMSNCSPARRISS